jgi:hypothetical protein
MTTKKTTGLSADEIREKLAKVAKNSQPLIIQEAIKVEPPKKTGRKNHKIEGVEYERLGVKVPVHLKDEMIAAMRTTHKEFKTMDLFVAEALRVLLSLKR